MSWHPINRDVVQGIDTCHIFFLPLGHATSVRWFHPDLVSSLDGRRFFLTSHINWCSAAMSPNLPEYRYLGHCLFYLAWQRCHYTRRLPPSETCPLSGIAFIVWWGLTTNPSLLGRYTALKYWLTFHFDNTSERNAELLSVSTSSTVPLPRFSWFQSQALPLSLSILQNAQAHN